MNHASMASPRLRRVQNLLSDGRERTTLEIIREAQVCAVNSVIAELRENGAVIAGRWETRESGGRVFLYRMSKAAPLTRPAAETPDA